MFDPNFRQKISSDIRETNKSKHLPAGYLTLAGRLINPIYPRSKLQSILGRCWINKSFPKVLG